MLFVRREAIVRAAKRPSSGGLTCKEYWDIDNMTAELERQVQIKCPRGSKRRKERDLRGGEGLCALHIPPLILTQGIPQVPLRPHLPSTVIEVEMQWSDPADCSFLRFRRILHLVEPGAYFTCSTAKITPLMGR